MPCCPTAAPRLPHSALAPAWETHSSSLPRCLGTFSFPAEIRPQTLPYTSPATFVRSSESSPPSPMNSYGSIRRGQTQPQDLHTPGGCPGPLGTGSPRRQLPGQEPRAKQGGFGTAANLPRQLPFAPLLQAQPPGDPLQPPGDPFGDHGRCNGPGVCAVGGVCVCVCECTRVGRVPARSRAGDVTPARGAAPPRRGFGKHLALGHGLHNGTRGPCQRRAAHGQVTPAPAGWERGSQEPPCSSQRAASPQGAEGGQDLALLSP